VRSGQTEDRLGRIRFIFLVFSVATAAVLITVAAVAGTDRRLETIAAALLLPPLVWKWIEEYRGRSLPLVGDLAEPAALLIVGATSHDPTSLLILLYARISTRSLDASSRRVVVLSAGYSAAFLGSVALTSPNWGLNWQSLPFVFLASGFALAPPVMHLLSDTMARLVRTTARERSLRQALDELSAALTVEATRAAAVRAVAHLVNDSAIRVRIAEGDADALQVVAVGDHPDERAVLDADASCAQLSPEQRAQLDRGSLQLTGPDVKRLWRDAGGVSPAELFVVAPVVGDASPVHILLAGAALGEETRLAVTALAEHIASRLHAARLSHDLQLREGVERMQQLTRHAADVMAVIDREAAVRYASPASTRLFGISPQELQGRLLTDLVHPDDVAQVKASLAGAVRGRTMSAVEIRVSDGHSGWREVEAVGTTMFRDQGMDAMVVTLRDIGERKRMETVLRDSEDNFRHVFDSNPLPMWLHDVETGNFLEVNDAAIKHYGYAREEFLAMHLRDVAVNGEGSDSEQHRASSGRTIQVQTESSRVVFHGHDAVLMIARDVGEQLELQRRLEHSALHDPITGLANQVLLRERVVEATELAQRRGEWKHAMLVLDLDDFKTVNDTLGHTMGDRVIGVVGARLGRCLKARDTAARIGGDEFAILLDGVNDEETATRVVARIMRQLRRPIRLQGRTLRVNASCGIAFLRPDHARPEELVSDADIAMYAAKAQGAGTTMVFDPALRAALMDRLNLEHDLAAALRRDELSVVFQPQVDLVSGRAFAVEALVRWQHPDRGPIPPDVFIPLAERMGIVPAIDEWVLRAALHALRDWTDQGLHDLRLAVNLSGQDLGRDDLVATVRHALLEAMIDPWRLELEITETAAVAQPEGAIERLQELRAMGVHIAIDDFGTGFSMLSRLRELPIDRLKIDRSFVTDLARDIDARAIVGSTIAMGHALGLDLCAEGVESDATAELLRELGCDSAQGYHFSRPLPAAELAAWLRERSARGVVINLSANSSAQSAPPAAPAPPAPPVGPRRAALRRT
jgi:diguanylate cyclase (GGDEF)-like protein/PAS domain S-box-containing protein